MSLNLTGFKMRRVQKLTLKMTNYTPKHGNVVPIAVRLYAFADQMFEIKMYFVGEVFDVNMQF